LDRGAAFRKMKEVLQQIENPHGGKPADFQQSIANCHESEVLDAG
jgi:hypothetical protein